MTKTSCSASKVKKELKTAPGDCHGRALRPVLWDEFGGFAGSRDRDDRGSADVVSGMNSAHSTVERS